MPGLRRLAVTGVALLAMTGVAACGDDSPDQAEDTSATSSTPSSTPTESTTESSPTVSPTPTSEPPTPAPPPPPCSEVWVDGKRLPDTYKGCSEGDTVVKAHKHPCSSGQTIVDYGGRFYAPLGQRITEVESLARDQKYHQALAACQA